MAIEEIKLDKGTQVRIICDNIHNDAQYMKLAKLKSKYENKGWRLVDQHSTFCSQEFVYSKY